jgi:hypothetical protein
MSSSSSPQYEASTKRLVARGTAVFAGVMLITVAIFQILEGIAAIAEDTFFVTGLNYTFEFDVTTWGWIHLIIGIVAVATGLGILAGQAWGMLVGIMIATIGAISHFVFMPYYPFWSMVVVAFNVLVIWALATEFTND